MKKLGKEIADEDIDISKYYFKVRWYSLEDLIRHRLKPKSGAKVRELVDAASYTLHELLFFKTDIQCENCDHDEYLALTDLNHEKLYLCCNFCDHCKSLDGHLIETAEGLLPITPDLQEKYGLRSSKGY